MNIHTHLLLAITLLSLAVPASVRLCAQQIPPTPELYKFTPEFDISSLKKQKTDASIVQDGDKSKLKIEFMASTSSFPNVQFPCPVGGWNLSAYQGIQGDITNPGTTPIRIVFRVDNNGDPKSTPPPWNTSGLDVPPGETKTLQLPFGKNWGQPAFPLDSKAVTGIQIFMVKPAENTVALISDITAY